MPTRSCSVFVVFLFIASLFSPTVFAAEPEAKRDNPLERENWFLRGRKYQGRIAPQLLRHAQQQRDVLRRQALQRAQVRSALSFGATQQPQIWKELGPAPLKSVANFGDNQDYGFVTGRATTVVVDQSDPSGNTVYVGGAYGGVWKSTSAANPDVNSVVWQPIIDDQATTAVGAIAIQPNNSNLLLVGTGEANSSADSYYGLGILRSTDGGISWQLIASANGGLRPFQGLAFSRIAFSTDNPNLVVAATAAASAGITVGAEYPPNGSASCANPGVNATCRGLYYSLDAGLTWNQATMVDGPAITPDNGSASSVIYNPAQHKFYAVSRGHGFYVSSDGMTFTRMGADAFGYRQPNAAITTSCPSSPVDLINCPLYRGEIAIVPGRDEMYVWYVNADATPVNGGIYQTRDGGKTWVSLNVNGIENCGDPAGCGTEQGTYNLALAAIPNGATATDVYAGAINIYRCQINSNNPTCATNGFVNLTHVYGCSPAGSFSKVHPDQHGFDFLHSNPNFMHFANDGGVYRTLAALNALSVPTSCPASAPATPFYPFENLNGTIGSMTQFVWFSQHPTDESTLLGGTQDNGSPAIDAANSGTNGLTWRSVQGGDGGYNEINPENTSEWFASNTRVSIYRCTNGTACSDAQFLSVVNSSTLGGDSGAFYTPYMLDPQDSTKMIVGTCRVWRIGTNGANVIALSQKFDGSGSTLACSESARTFVSALAAGGPVTGSGSQVIYAGMDDGKVFVTTSALSSTTAWMEASAGGGFSNPNGYPISGIAIDPRDASGKTAYVTVMGFRTAHVWRTADAGATWSNVTGNLPDSPADAIVVDKNTGAVYVGTDVGVFSTSAANGTSTMWTEVGPATGIGALPNVAVTRLAIFQPTDQPGRLRVSTYGRGVWEIPIPITTTPEYELTVEPVEMVTYPSRAVDFNGVLTGFNNYSSQVALSCEVRNGPLPSLCTPVPSSAVPTAAGTNFAVRVADAAVGDFDFNVKGVGQDSNSLVRQAAVKLRVIDFSLGSPSPSTISGLGRGESATVNVAVTSLGSFDQQVTVGCNSFDLPSNWACSQSTLTLLPGDTVSTTITITTDAATLPGTYNLELIGTCRDGINIRAHIQPISVEVIAQSGFTVESPPANVVKLTQPLTATITVSPHDGYTGKVSLTCTGDTSSGIAPSACSFNPATVEVGPTTSATSVLSVSTVAGIAGSGEVNVQASDGNNTKNTSLRFMLADYSVSNVTIPNDSLPGGTVNFSFQLTPSVGYIGAVALSCDASTTNVPVSCTFSPASPITLDAGTARTVSGSIAIPSSAPEGIY